MLPGENIIQQAEHPDGYVLSTDRTRIDVDWVLRTLQASFWGGDRTRSDMERAIANSWCWGIYTTTGEQVGFARLLSDTFVLAYVMDVVVDPAHQRKGLGKWIMHHMELHPDLCGVRTWRLRAKDPYVRKMYQELGWKGAENPDRFMDKDHDV